MSIDDFAHSDEASCLDPNSQLCVAIAVEDDKVKHTSRVWEVSTWHKKHMLFKQSEVMRTCLACMCSRQFQNEKNRFLGAQPRNFHVCGCTLCMVSIDNVNARVLTMLSVIEKYKHIGQVYKIFV